MASRPGILTSTQREYLKGDHEPPSTDAENHLRASIRGSLLQTFDDLALISARLGEEDFDLVKWQHQEDPRERPDLPRYQPAGFLLNTIPSAVNLLYRLRPNPDVFGEYIEMGVKDALEREGYKAHVRVSIDVDDPTHKSEILEKLEDGGIEAITQADITFLQRAGELDAFEAAELSMEKTEQIEEELPGRRLMRATDKEAKRALLESIESDEAEE